MNEGVYECVHECVYECVNECVYECVYERVSECVSKCISECVYECVYVYVSLSFVVSLSAPPRFFPFLSRVYGLDFPNPFFHARKVKPYCLLPGQLFAYAYLKHSW